jgi:hypothetical protein
LFLRSAAFGSGSIYCEVTLHRRQTSVLQGLDGADRCVQDASDLAIAQPFKVLERDYGALPVRELVECAVHVMRSDRALNLLLHVGLLSRVRLRERVVVPVRASAGVVDDKVVRHTVQPRTQVAYWSAPTVQIVKKPDEHLGSEVLRRGSVPNVMIDVPVHCIIVCVENGAERRVL